MKKGGDGERVFILNSKGQGATGATMLMLIILALFLVFAAITNPEEFKATLSGNGTIGSTTTFNVGILQEGLDGNTTKQLSSVTLETLENTKPIARFPDVTASNGFFSRTTRTHTFTLASPETTDTIYLGFTLREHKGTLIVTINGNAIATGTYETNNPSPITIPPSYLKKENTIEFSTESGFFSSASYKLTDVIIIGTLHDTAPLTKTNTFTLSPSEFDSALSGTLTYTPRCNESTTTMNKISIALNGNTLVNETPTCGQSTTLPLSKKTVKLGTNSITYHASKKTTIENPTLSLSNTAGKHFTTTYTLSTIPKKIELKLLLPDDGTKDFTVKYNNNEQSYSTTERVYVVDLTAISRTGVNTLDITPRGTITVPTITLVKQER